MSKSRHYETTYILTTESDEAQRNKIQERLTEILQNAGGNLLRVDEWGKRELAYPIQKQGYGFYVYLRYTAPGEVIAELERILRLLDPVLKFLTVALDPRKTAASKTQEDSPVEENSAEDAT